MEIIDPGYLFCKECVAFGFDIENIVFKTWHELHEMKLVKEIHMTNDLGMPLTKCMVKRNVFLKRLRDHGLKLNDTICEHLEPCSCGKDDNECECQTWSMHHQHSDEEWDRFSFNLEKQVKKNMTK
jgi:hypothetical protein